MASFSQNPFLSSLLPINKTTSAFSPHPKTLFTFKNSKIPSSNSQPSPNFQENSEEDPFKLAVAKAKAYKKSTQSNTPTPTTVKNPLQQVFSGKNDDGSESNQLKDDEVNKEIPLAVKLALEKAKEYKKGKSEGAISKIVQKSAEIDEKNDGSKSDEVKKDDGGEKEVPLAVKLALDKAKEYKKGKGVVGSDTLASGLEGMNEKSGGDTQSVKNGSKKDELSISSMDFIGLGFADKKSGRDLPAGLVPLIDPFPEGDLPEVEILVGDATKFGNSKSIPIEEEDDDLYKPKVSTWGVFPRPNDISKAYGGGRTLQPGEALETVEEKAAKQARTKQLLAAYKKKLGLNIDPKLKSECEKALKDGDSLMDSGELKEALTFYEQVMEKLPFQSELHGLAALQWSICQDSLSRSSEARIMYEKLQSHPSPKVSKKAKQFVFSFQAMEMMKVRSLNSSPTSTGYQNYFEAFVQNKTANYASKEDEVEEEGAALSQALPYVIFLASPILMVLLIAASR